MWHRPKWNDLSRYDLIMVMVEEGTVRIDSYQMNTEDKAVFQGHYYSDKAPGLAFLGVPVYWVLNHIISLTGLDHSTQDWVINLLWRIKLLGILVLTLALPSALLGVLFFDFLTRLPIPQRFALWLTLGYSLGTLAFPYSTVFYGHQFAAVCLFTAFYIIRFIIARERSDRGNLALLWLAGFLMGYAVITEYPCVLLVPVFMGYLWVKKKNFKSMSIFTLGMIIPLAILLYYNYICSGNIFKIGYAGTVFQQGTGHGVTGLTFPNLSALWGITFSLYRGLFLINPFLLFAFPGFCFMYKNVEWRKEFWICISAVILFLLFNSSFYMWWGGWTLGPRHLIPMLPFLLLSIAFVPKEYQKYVCVLIILSMIFMWIGTVVDPQIPETEWNPLFGYAFSQFIHGNVSLNLGTVLFIIYIPGGVYLMGIVITLWSWLLLRKTEGT